MADTPKAGPPAAAKASRGISELIRVLGDPEPGSDEYKARWHLRQAHELLGGGPEEAATAED